VAAHTRRSLRSLQGRCRSLPHPFPTKSIVSVPAALAQRTRLRPPNPQQTCNVWHTGATCRDVRPLLLANRAHVPDLGRLHWGRGPSGAKSSYTSWHGLATNSNTVQEHCHAQIPQIALSRIDAESNLRASVKPFRRTLNPPGCVRKFGRWLGTPLVELRNSNKCVRPLCRSVPPLRLLPGLRPPCLRSTLHPPLPHATDTATATAPVLLSATCIAGLLVCCWLGGCGCGCGCGFGCGCGWLAISW